MRTASRCNLLWITCDEMQARALPLGGNQALAGRLPSIQRLTQEGTTFTNCFCQMPKCIPMRGMLLTGRYAHPDGLRTMSRANFDHRNMMLLDETSPSLLSWLRTAGWSLGLAGRQHVLTQDGMRALGVEVLTAGRSSQPIRLDAPPPPELERAYFGGRVDGNFDQETCYDALQVQAAVKFIRRSRNEPWACLVDISQPHPPYCEWPGLVDDVPIEDVPLPPMPPLDQVHPVLQAWRRSHGTDTLSDSERRRIVRAYWSQCVWADARIGRLLDALDQSDQTTRTLVVFGSDHGDFVGAYGCWEKWDNALYDSVVRVPLTLRLPGAVPAGQIRDALVESIDISPTVCELLGLPVPASVHGRSLRPAMADPGLVHRDAVFSQGGVEPEAVAVAAEVYADRLLPCYCGKQRTLVEHPWALQRAHLVRTERHAMIYRLDGHHELYDLDADPWQLRNVWDDPSQRETRIALQERLLDFFCRYQNESPTINELWA